MPATRMPALPDSVWRNARTGVANVRVHGVWGTAASPASVLISALPRASGEVDVRRLLADLPQPTGGLRVAREPGAADDLRRPVGLARARGPAVRRARQVGGRGHQDRPRPGSGRLGEAAGHGVHAPREATHST